MKKNIYYFLISLLLMTAFACSAKSNKEIKNEPSLKGALKGIFYIGTAPATQRRRILL